MPRFIRRISDSALQFLINQAFGLGLFYVLSRGLDKEQFGELNWTLAVFLTAFNILALGLDQMSVRKIAAGDAPEKVLSLYRTHVLLTGGVFYTSLLVSRYLFPGFFAQHSLLLWIGLAKTGLFFSTPYKQLASGREQFGVLLRMSICSSIFKGIVLISCFLLHVLTLPVLLVVFIAGDLAEWQISAYLGRKILQNPLSSAIDRKGWFLLIRESLPQVGVVLFSSAMARFDWIFIGLFSSAPRLAEYSFAYKAFEVSSVPLLIIAPLLIPFFTRLFKQDQGRAEGQDRTQGHAQGQGDLPLLLRGELILGCWTAMLLNVGWSPLIDSVTAGRYGAVNAPTVFILSLCLPLLYLNNFLWTVHFARGRFKMIFWVFALSFVCNVGGDIWLIPLYGNIGAAAAYFLAIGLQTILYGWNVRESSLKWSWITLLISASGAALSGYFSRRLLSGVFPQLLCASLFYVIILLLAGQLRPADYRYLRSKIS